MFAPLRGRTCSLCLTHVCVRGATEFAGHESMKRPVSYSYARRTFFHRENVLDSFTELYFGEIDSCKVRVSRCLHGSRNREGPPRKTDSMPLSLRERRPCFGVRTRVRPRESAPEPGGNEVGRAATEQKRATGQKIYLTSYYTRLPFGI